MVIVIEVN